MTHDFEYISYNDADRIAVLENRAAELERRLLAVIPPGGAPAWSNVATPGTIASEQAPADESYPGEAYGSEAYADEPYAGQPYPEGQFYPDESGRDPAGLVEGDAYPGEAAADDGAADQAVGPDGRTEALINHGRQRAKRTKTRLVLAHWRILAVGSAALLVGVIVTLLALPGGGASWPASVTTVQAEIKQACKNPDVAAEPSGLNFACGKDTQQVLWVFSLLTSGDNPGYVDQATGRKGLEPIQPSQGGDIAWSLNLHHPYNPASPTDSLEVAARAINNIISGATLTSTSGGALVEPGLESKAANCQRYTGSAQLVTPPGYPARCASPVTSAAGEAALVSDVFQQWMGGTPSLLASEAGVLFENANNPGAPRVQAILDSLPASGL